MWKYPPHRRKTRISFKNFLETLSRAGFERRCAGHDLGACSTNI